MKKQILFSSFLLLFFSLSLKAQLKTNGYLSFEYTKGQKESNFSQGTFRNIRAGLIFSGEMAEKFDYILEMRLEEEATFEIEQAWVGFNPSPSFKLKLGFYLVPFGKYNRSHRAHETELVNIPLPLEEIYPQSWRDLGVLVEGKVGFLLYSGYLGNGLVEGENLGAGQQFKDNNSDKGKGARIGLLLGKSFEVGFSYYRGKQDEDNERNLILEGVDLTWATEGIHLFSEYAKARIENPEPFSPGKAEGYFIQISFKVENFWAVVSYQDLSYKDSFHGLGFVSPGYAGRGIFKEKSRWALGLDYFVSQNILFKLEYDFNREKKISLKDNTFSAQIALNF